MSENKNFKEETIKLVNLRIKELQDLGMLDIPSDYSVGNALQYAWFKLQELKGGANAKYAPALEICEPDSIVFSLVKMVTDGLTVAKSQCYFMVRKAGNKFNLDYGQEYQGKIALAKRYSGILSIDHQVVYNGEHYEVKCIDGIKSIEHQPDMDKFDYDQIKGAYCVVTEKDDKKKAFELSMQQIEISWLYQFVDKDNPIEKLLKEKTRLKSVHSAFKPQMCEKAVINYAMKGYINRSNDSAIIPEKKELPEAKETLSINTKQPEKKTLEIKPEEKKPVEITKEEEGPGY